MAVPRKYYEQDVRLPVPAQTVDAACRSLILDTGSHLQNWRVTHASDYGVPPKKPLTANLNYTILL